MRNPVNFIFYIVFIYQDCFGRPGRLLFSAILFYKDYGGSQADQGGCANQCGRIFLQALLKAGARTKTAEVAMDELEATLSSPDSVEGTIEAKELTCMLEAFLDTLPTKNREIFLRRYWFYESCAEIAEAVGLSEKNITVRLTRIRTRLKKYLTEREVFL